MNEIIQKIEQVFNENLLIGNYDFTEDEYSLMVDYVNKLGDNFDLNVYNTIFATLVEISKRWKDSDIVDESDENPGFWNFIFKTLTGTEEFNPKLYSAFIGVISEMDSRNDIPVVKTGKKYYATLMMHSFAPKNSIFSFFDLCYNIFKKDLDFGFTTDDEWLCEKVANEMRIVLSGGYREDKKVHIGSSAYSIKIGLRSYTLNEKLSGNFIEFIKNTFYQINKLFNKEKIREDTRLQRYIVEWWRNKTESEKLSDETTRKVRVPTVSKQNIIAKYIRNDNKVSLCIPSIRLENDTITMELLVYIEGKLKYSEKMITKRGELVVATKQKEFELNDLLKEYKSINIRIEIKENGVVIFDSDKNKMTSLNREFILFDGEKEIFSQINKPINYFVYSKNIDALRNIPKELTTYGNNIYNIYPNAGECLVGESKQVYFINKEKEARLGKNVCLIGNLTNVEWFLDEISCVVYDNGVKLMVPETLNLKALELRIDRKSYKLQDLTYEQLENNSYQFGLKSLGLISEKEPIEVSLYSYEKEATLLSETIILLPNFDIKFNKSCYYGDIERGITVITDNESRKLSWTNKDNEIQYPSNDGVLLIKIPYFRWRINDREWHNEPINKKLWYKEFLSNGDLLEIDNPKEDEEIVVFGIANRKPFEITKNQSGRFEIGRAIFTNEGETDISVYCSNEKEKFELFNLATKEHFIDNPLIYKNEMFFWDVENTFIGDKNNDFFLILKGEGSNNIRIKIEEENKELNDIEEDIYKVIVKIKDKNIFFNNDNYDTIYEGNLIGGRPEKFRFKNKKLLLKKARCYHNDKSYTEWISFRPQYFIDNLEFVKEDENFYYRGRLCVIDQYGKKIVLNTMENEKESYDKTNPVRIELRDNSTLWLVAGWQGGYDFIGNLFCDLRRRGICNIAKEDISYSEITLYKFEEVYNV